MSDFDLGREHFDLPPEPGVERDAEGRITATGWPHVPRVQWPETAALLQRHLDEQKRYEQLLFAKGNINFHSVIRHGQTTFNLASMDMLEDVKQALDARQGAGETPRIVDIGGGNGRLLNNAILFDAKAMWRSVSFPEGRIEGVMTSLSSLDQRMIDQHAEVFRHVPDFGIELPPDAFYQAFDAAVATNSIFFWSQFPELAATNLHKILRPGGEAFVTVPSPGNPIHASQPDMFRYLTRGSRLFALESHTPMENKRTIALHLRRR